MNMKTLQPQLEKIGHIILIRELLNRSKELGTGKFQYQTDWLDWDSHDKKPLVPLTTSKQLKLLHALQKKDVVETEDLIWSDDGTVEVKGEYIPSEGGRLVNVLLHEKLEKAYRGLSGDLYSPLVGSGEMAFQKQVNWMKKYLKQKTAQANRCQVTVESRDVPPDINPYLCILHLEAIGFLAAVASLTSDQEVIAEVTINRDKRGIGTSRFLYDLETEILMYKDGKEVHRSTNGQIGRIIIAIAEEAQPLSDKAVHKIVRSKSTKTLQSFTSEQLNKINKEYPIIHRVKGNWEFIE